MTFRVTCRACGAGLQVPLKYAGRTVRCPKCRETFQTPAAPPSPEPSESAAEPGPTLATGGDRHVARPAAPPSAPPPAPSRSAEPAVAPHTPAATAPVEPQAPGFSPDEAGSDYYNRLRGRHSRKKSVPRLAVNRKTGLIAAGVAVCLLLAGAIWAVAIRPKTDNAAVAQTTPDADLVDESDEWDELDEPQAVKPRPSKPGEELSLADMIELVDQGIVLINGLDSFGEEVALGSGFVIDKSGLVATNYHVTAAAAQAHVQFRDGSKAKVLGYRAYDPSRDLAIVEIDGDRQRLKPLALAGSENPRQGSDVVAIGHPSGFKFTTTTGIVSGVFKTTELPNDVQYFLSAPPDNVWIQTNAVISSGNSGGPLLNRRGEVIGINTWVAGGAKLGFATHVRHLTELRETKLLGTVLSLDVAGAPGVSDETPLGKIDTRVAAIVNEFRRAHEEFLVKVRQAGEAEQQSLIASNNPVAVFAPKLLDFAESNRNTAAAFQALFIACHLLPQAPPNISDPAALRATKQLLEDHVEEKQLKDLALALAEQPYEATPAFLRQLKERSPHRDVQGAAAYCLASALNAQAEARGGDDEHDEEILVLLEDVVENYASVIVGGSTLGDLAEPKLFERKHLAVGKTAPEIEGRDIDGQFFKLSEYRGRVVVLDFWGDWCPFCVEMYPQQRLMVERFKDRPFVMLGVNTDTRDRLRSVTDLKKVTWRSWWDGRGGPIATRWNVDSIPTVYVLDHEGVIRFKDLRGDELEEAVEALLKDVP